MTHQRRERVVDLVEGHPCFEVAKTMQEYGGMMKLDSKKSMVWKVFWEVSHRTTNGVSTKVGATASVGRGSWVTILRRSTLCFPPTSGGVRNPLVASWPVRDLPLAHFLAKNASWSSLTALGSKMMRGCKNLGAQMSLFRSVA